MLVGCSSSSSSSANVATDFKSIPKKRRPHRRQSQIAEALASFAQEISNLEAFRNEDPEIVAAELALFEEELPLTSNAVCAPGVTVGEAAFAMSSEAGGRVSSSRGLEDQRREALPASHSKADAWDSRRSSVIGGPTRDVRKGILSSSAVRALVYDYAMMKRNIRDYDISLRTAIAEAERLKKDVADMRYACGEVEQLQQALVSELATQTQLQQENADLIASTDALRCAIQGALEADGDLEEEAFIDALANENAMLWSLVSLSQAASKMKFSLPASPSLQNRQSLSSRSRTSSGSAQSLATPSRASPSSPSRQGESSSPIRDLVKTNDVFAEMLFQSLGDLDSEPIAAEIGDKEQVPMEALASKAIAALQGRTDGVASKPVDGSGTSRFSHAQGAGSRQRYGALAEVVEDRPLTTLDKLDFEDEMSEVSSLVESAILQASPRRNNPSAQSSVILNVEQDSELSPEAAIAGAVGRVIATGNIAESTASSAQSVDHLTRASSES